ncbi:MAG: MBOAT family protein [Lachnospiraceae bacterium]|nr:MBOAT family protein [Lachnospiraceae bacterium]
MLFNSYIFIFLFLPLALAGYFVLNHFKCYELGKLFLVGMSLWFYAYFHLSYLWILLCSIALNYICHLLLIHRFHTRFTAFAGILLNICILYYFKYFDFVIETINGLTGSHISVSGVLLPLGISFFTFQQIGFLADSAKGSVDRQKPLDYALFVSFFPQLIAGPIVSHEEMLPQFSDISKKRLSAENFYFGLRIFILGLGKKVLLADTFGQAVYWGFQHYTALDGLNTFLVALFYTLQLYFDFSGYCDMARGIGRMFNIQIPVNFLSPYKSASILEFWDRWHITLTRFFTKYIYIPLGGNRRGILRTCLNVLFVFCISGLWHGAGWTFLLWGLLHGVFSVLTRLWRILKSRFIPQALSHPKAQPVLKMFGILLTFLFLNISWTLFRAESLSQAGYMLRNIFTFRGTHIYAELAGYFQLHEFWYIIKFFHLDALPYASYYCMFGITAVALVLIFACRNLHETESSHRPGLINTLSLTVLGVWCVLSLSGVSTFLYFNF